MKILPSAKKPLENLLKNALRIKYLDRLSEQFVNIEFWRILSTIILWKYVSHTNHRNPRILSLNRTMVLIFAKMRKIKISDDLRAAF